MKSITKDLAYYVHCFTRLKRDNKNGGAPHKPILLLSLIALFEKKICFESEVFIIPELVGLFKKNWSKLVVTNHHPNFALPFYHMNSEPFWKLIPTIGCEKWIESKSSMKSFTNLNTAVHSAVIDKELLVFLKEAESRDVLKISILDKYFPSSKTNYTSSSNDELLSDVNLHESSEEYRRKILDLKTQVDENSFYEEVFVRSGVFKREIVKIYNNTCAISGMRIVATSNISMVDACHIVPFSESYDDTINNGIALCPTLHRAFDRGLISISDDYTVLVKDNFVENIKSTYNITQFENRSIYLPKKASFLPSKENLHYHRNKFNF